MLIHVLILFVLAKYIIGFENNFHNQGKETTLIVNLKPVINKGLQSSANLTTTTSKLLLPNELDTQNADHPKLDKQTSSILPALESSHHLLELQAPPSPYYTIKELDKIPSILENVDSNPPELLQFPQGGELTIRVWIDDKGSVIKTEIVKSDLPEEFNKSALKRFLGAKFTPGIKNNIPVNTVAKITVKYASKGVD